VQNKLDKFEEKIKEHLTNIGGKFKSQKWIYFFTLILRNPEEFENLFNG
jgi:hypothetical protein